jgi:hypothetical protein
MDRQVALAVTREQMSLARPSRQRVAVIIPQHRTWSWHQRAISALRQDYNVEVFTTAHASPYPSSLKLLSSAERRIFGAYELVESASISAAPWPGPEGENKDAEFALVINLSEAPITYQRAPVIELKFDGTADSSRLFATLLARKNPYLSFQVTNSAPPIVASYLCIEDKTVLARGLQLAFSRLVTLTARAVHHLLAGTRAPIPRESAAVSHQLSSVRIFGFFVRSILSGLFRVLVRQFQLPGQWSTALLASNDFDIPSGIPLQKFAVLPDDRRRYYADPFVLSENGKTWLFVEEFEFAKNKGVISCALVKKNGEIDGPRCVLARPYHLSYPFVFRHGSDVFMIPETGGNRTIELYRARSFPCDWVLCQVLMKDIEAYDVTLLQHQDKWWIFCSLAQPGGSTQDELAIFYSDALEGPWTPHPLNPVKSDCRSARPAGKVVVQDGRLLRPAQDCEESYGGGLVWLEIEELTNASFREKEITRWPGRAAKADGLHTFNCDSGVAVIDIKRNVSKRFL